MTEVLVILGEPERSAMALDRLATRVPGVVVHTEADVAAALSSGALAKAEVLVSIGPALGASAGAAFAGAPNLSWVQSIGTGVDNMLGHPALAAHVTVTNVRGVHGAQMSEAAIGAMLALARDLPRALANQRAARWERYAPRRIAGDTVAIVGLGAIASALAPRLRALGLTVVGVSATAGPRDGFDRVEARDDLARVVAGVDWLVLLTPYTSETHHLIDAQILSAMRPSAYLINLARGGVVDEAALLAALDAGQLAGAALDVFADEPLPPDSPFWSHGKVIVTPHIGGFHAAYPDDVLAVVADNLMRYRAHGAAALLNRVN